MVKHLHGYSVRIPRKCVMWNLDKIIVMQTITNKLYYKRTLPAAYLKGGINS